MAERRATPEEVIQTVLRGQQFEAKRGRTGFRLDLTFDADWRGRHYAVKQIEAYAAENDGWLVITFITKYF